jgi:hypothetical protein
MHFRYYLLAVVITVSSLARASQEPPDAEPQNKSNPSVRRDERTGNWFQNDQPYSGPIIHHYADGGKHREFTVRDGVLHGLYLWYYKDGKLHGMMTYSKGKADGVRYQWSKTGELFEVTPFANGRIHGVFAHKKLSTEDTADVVATWEMYQYYRGELAKRFRLQQGSLANLEVEAKVETKTANKNLGGDSLKAAPQD